MDSLKRRLSNFALKHLLNAVLPEQVLEVRQGKVFLGGNPIPESTVKALAEEAKWWKQSNLDTILVETLKNTAQRAMFDKSQTFQDVLSGKLLLYAIDTQRKLIDMLSKMR